MAEIDPGLSTYCEPIAFPFIDSMYDLSMFYMYTY